VAGITAAVRDVPPAASRRHGVSDARARNGVREGGLPTACGRSGDMCYSTAYSSDCENYIKTETVRYVLSQLEKGQSDWLEPWHAYTL
jgi:hypothetical protein